MRLLLLEDVRKLGHVGDVVDVKPGYARNYLLPHNLATWPTEENIQAIEERKRAAAAERARLLKEYEGLIEQLQNVSITIEAAANPEGTLYGAVHEKQIADALAAQGFAIGTEHIVLDAPIRTLDSRLITLEFTDELSTQVKLWVVREGAAVHGDDADQPEQDDQPVGSEADVPDEA
jgi:large subunit ribosomal protein L9